MAELSKVLTINITRLPAKERLKVWQDAG